MFGKFLSQMSKVNYYHSKWGSKELNHATTGDLKSGGRVVKSRSWPPDIPHTTFCRWVPPWYLAFYYTLYLWNEDLPSGHCNLLQWLLGRGNSQLFFLSLFPFQILLQVGHDECQGQIEEALYCATLIAFNVTPNALFPLRCWCIMQITTFPL